MKERILLTTAVFLFLIGIVRADPIKYVFPYPYTLPAFSYINGTDLYIGGNFYPDFSYPYTIPFLLRYSLINGSVSIVTVIETWDPSGMCEYLGIPCLHGNYTYIDTGMEFFERGSQFFTESLEYGEIDRNDPQRFLFFVSRTYFDGRQRGFLDYQYIQNETTLKISRINLGSNSFVADIKQTDDKWYVLWFDGKYGDPSDKFNVLEFNKTDYALVGGRLVEIPNIVWRGGRVYPEEKVIIYNSTHILEFDWEGNLMRMAPIGGLIVDVLYDNATNETYLLKRVGPFGSRYFVISDFYSNFVYNTTIGSDWIFYPVYSTMLKKMGKVLLASTMFEITRMDITDWEENYTAILDQEFYNSFTSYGGGRLRDVGGFEFTGDRFIAYGMVNTSLAILDVPVEMDIVNVSYYEATHRFTPYYSLKLPISMTIREGYNEYYWYHITPNVQRQWLSASPINVSISDPYFGFSAEKTLSPPICPTMEIEIFAEQIEQNRYRLKSETNITNLTIKVKGISVYNETLTLYVAEGERLDIYQILNNTYYYVNFTVLGYGGHNILVTVADDICGVGYGIFLDLEPLYPPPSPPPPPPPPPVEITGYMLFTKGILSVGGLLLIFALTLYFMEAIDIKLLILFIIAAILFIVTMSI